MPHIRVQNMVNMESGAIIAMVAVYRDHLSREEDEVIRTTYRQIIEEYRAELESCNRDVATGGVL